MQRQSIAAFIFGLVCFFSLDSALLATDYYGQPGEFLRYSPSARALAMGRAYTAVGQDANALHWNPGALAQLQHTGLSLVGTQASLFGQAGYSSVSFGLPFEIVNAPFFQALDNLTLGVSFLNLTSEINAANEFAQLTNNTMSSSQGALSLALASSNNFPFFKNFTIGAGIDYVWNNLFGLQKNAVGVNAGLFYRNDAIEGLNWFSLGLAVKNANEPDISPDGGGDEIVPMTGRFGLAFLPPFGSTAPRFFQPMLLSLDYDLFPISGNQRGLYVGMEYNISRVASHLPLRLRLGTNTKESAFTFGLSLDLPANPFMKKGLEYLPSLDYSFNFYNEGDYLGNVKQGAISFAWTPKTPADWYKEGMKFYPANLLSQFNREEDLRKARQCFERVFDNPQALLNPNYAPYGYQALLRMGDLEIASAWLRNDREGLLQGALRNYAKADECLPPDQAFVAEEINATSLLYRLQADLQNSQFSIEQVFQQPYVAKIDDQPHVQFLKGYSYYLAGDVTNAVAAWQSLQLPIARYFLAKSSQKLDSLQDLAFSTDTIVSEKILFPLIADFNVADNALFDYASLTNSREWMIILLKIYPLSDVREEIYTILRKGNM